MSEPVTPATDLSGDLAGSAVRHVAGYLAGLLAGAGAISHDQQAQAATLLASVLMYLAVQGWSFGRKILRARRAA